MNRTIKKLLTHHGTLFTILIIAAAIRLVAFDQSLWHDEATTALVAQESISHYFTQFAPADFHPPLHYFAVFVSTTILGHSDWAARLPSILFGLGTVALVYLITRELKPKADWLAGLLMATAPLHIYYSQEARMYAMAAFFVTLAVYALIKLESQIRKDGVIASEARQSLIKSGIPNIHLAESGRSSENTKVASHSSNHGILNQVQNDTKNDSINYTLFTLALAAAFLTHYLTLLTIPVFFIVDKHKQKLLKPISLSLAPFLLWLPIFSQQLTRGLTQTSAAWQALLGEPTLKNLALFPTKFILGRISLEPRWVYAATLIIIGYLMAMLIFTRFKQIPRNKLLISWLVTPPVLGFFLSFVIPVLQYFRFLFVLPALTILLGISISSIKTKRWKIIAALFFVSANVYFSQIYLTNPQFQREPWKQAVQKITRIAPPQSAVLFTTPTLPDAWRYYHAKYAQENITKATSPNNLEPTITTVFYFEYLADLYDPTGQTKAKLKDLGYTQSDALSYENLGAIIIYTKDNIYAKAP